MAGSSYERLSAQDNSFLVAEGPTTRMYVAALQIYERGDLATADGGVDFETVKKAFAAALDRVPRYRQKLQYAPLAGRPVWVDDPDFNLDYHMRHVSLPRPGGDEQLKQLAARVMAEPLDHARPLWETWVAEGLDGERFAAITKVHHCMVDGIAGADLAQILLSPEPGYAPAETPAFETRPPPGGLELLRDELLRTATVPWQLARGLGRFLSDTEDLPAALGQRARSVTELLGWALRPSSGSPLNGPVGPHRRFDWLATSLDEAKAVRRVAGCSLNDVVLAVVSGALRCFFEARGSDPAALDFRISAPVNVRGPEDRGRLGNRVSSWILRLPLGEACPRERLRAIHSATTALKESHQAEGVDMLMQLAEWAPPALLALGAQATAGPINSIVTNVPGPQAPLYLLGSRLLAMFPVAPLLPNMGLSTAIFSYDGGLFWGFNADYQRVPDLGRLPGLVEEAFAELREAFPASG